MRPLRSVSEKIAAASTALRYFLSIEAVIHESGSFVARGCTAPGQAKNQLGSNTLRYAGARAVAVLPERSDERRVGNECVRTGSSRGSPYHYKKITIKKLIVYDSTDR